MMQSKEEDIPKTIKINWHRLFGLTLTDFFTDSNYQVGLEKELSLKKQYLDVVIIEKATGNQIEKWPDGLENLAQHNLLTYKSLREPLDVWAIDELIGHYVNYRKQMSPSLDDLLPVSDFKLYAVSTSYPHKLGHTVTIKKIKDGVYDIQLGIHVIRLIVTRRIEKSQQNAIWHLFSGQSDKFVYGNKHYRWHCPDERAALNQLYDLYQLEGVNMPYTWEDFRKDFTKEHLHLLAPSERLNGIPTNERLNGIPINERLNGIPINERLKDVPKEAIEEYLSKLKQK